MFTSASPGPTIGGRRDAGGVPLVRVDETSLRDPSLGVASPGARQFHFRPRSWSVSSAWSTVILGYRVAPPYPPNYSWVTIGGVFYALASTRAFRLYPSTETQKARFAALFDTACRHVSEGTEDILQEAEQQPPPASCAWLNRSLASVMIYSLASHVTM